MSSARLQARLSHSSNSTALASRITPTEGSLWYCSLRKTAFKLSSCQTPFFAMRQRAELQFKHAQVILVNSSLPADDALPPPQPSDVDEGGNLPEKAPGTENKLPEQPAPEPKAPEDLGKVCIIQAPVTSLSCCCTHSPATTDLSIESWTDICGTQHSKSKSCTLIFGNEGHQVLVRVLWT